MAKENAREKKNGREESFFQIRASQSASFNETLSHAGSNCSLLFLLTYFHACHRVERKANLYRTSSLSMYSLTLQQIQFNIIPKTNCTEKSKCERFTLPCILCLFSSIDWKDFLHTFVWVCVKEAFTSSRRQLYCEILTYLPQEKRQCHAGGRIRSNMVLFIERMNHHNIHFAC